MSTPGAVLRGYDALLWLHEIAHFDHFERFERFDRCERNDQSDHLARVWTRGVYLPPCGGALLTEE